MFMEKLQTVGIWGEDNNDLVILIVGGEQLESYLFHGVFVRK